MAAFLLKTAFVHAGIVSSGIGEKPPVVRSGSSGSVKSIMHRVQSFAALPPVIFHKYRVEKTLENGVFGEVLKAYIRVSKNITVLDLTVCVVFPLFPSSPASLSLYVFRRFGRAHLGREGYWLIAFGHFRFTGVFRFNGLAEHLNSYP